MWATKIAIGVGVCFFLSFGAADVDFGSQMAVIDEEIVANLTSTASFNASKIPSVHQNVEAAPAFPILQVSRNLIVAAVNAQAFSNESAANDSGALVKRAAEPCSEGSPCPDKSCCSKGGKCGFGPDYCGKGNCTSNCDSTAMCGRYSEGGSLKCGMNLCCSYYGWCGTDEIHCGNPDEHHMTPCQEGFGLCEVIPPPSCGEGSANKRSIGYYQASNTKDRLCNRISPSQIDTTGFSHLYFAFAEIDPTNFNIVAVNDGDEDRYVEFNKLQNKGLKTWIAIGGFDFSDPGPTRTTWSDLASTSANRAAFISALKGFLSTYGFQGVDLDWEYPGTPERGGKQIDTENYVALVREIRAAFGTDYGLSLTLAPDYWYLRGFDAKAMEPYVDFFGFMAYDLHGFWDADLATLGSKVRGQSDVREIFNDTLPLWFDALDPAKINFGLAYYGRGYTLASPSCNQLECPFVGPSLAAPCTNFAGVMSLAEIKSSIAQKGLTPQLLEEPMMKQITWDNQWIGYDDEETVAMKKQWASRLCFGGTMVWSVDFNSGGGSGDDTDGGDAPVTSDGTCGPKNNGTVCGNWASGECCAASGFCGNTSAFCGNGCQSGPCYTERETTDGTCGPLHGNSICGSWISGSCCSAAGFCGSSEEFCGIGCVSGPCDDASNNSSGPSGDVYISPEIWTSADKDIYCMPPCVYILPPQNLSSTTTVTFPLYTTSLEVAWYTSEVITQDGKISTSVSLDRTTQKTTLTIPPLTTDRIDFWNVNVTVSSSSLVYLTSSILPPPFTITDDHNPGSQQGLTHPPVTRTITPPPFPYSTMSPGSDDHPPLTHRVGPPKNPCKIGCGIKCMGLFCHNPCLLDCVDGPLPGFHDPEDPQPESSDPTGDGSQSDETSSTSSCSKSTVTDFWVACSSIDGGSSGCKTTSTSSAAGCDVTASTIATSACALETVDADDDEGDETQSAESNGGALPSQTSAAEAPTPMKSPTSIPSSSIEPPPPAPSPTITPPSSPPSTTPLSPPPETTISNVPPAPPAPPKSTIAFAIGYASQCSPSGIGLGTGSSCSSNWGVFLADSDGKYDPCKSKSVWSDPKEFTANKPHYPVNEGPFGSGDVDGCNFVQNKQGDIGGLSCGETMGMCAEDKSGKNDCQDVETWIPVAVCTIVT